MSVEAWLAEGFMDRHPEDAAHVLETQIPEAVAETFKEIPEDIVARVLERMVTVAAAACLERSEIEFAAAIVASMHAPRALSVLRGSSPEWREHILSRIGSEGKKLREQLLYPADSAAALVDFSVLTLADDLTVEEANLLFRRNPHRAHYYLYVVDRDNTLSGVITLRELALHAGDESIANIMNRHLSYIVATESRAAVISHASWREYTAMPVVEEAGQFVGMIRHETVKMLELDEDGGEAGVKMVGKAIGELYVVGLSGVVQAIGSAFTAGRRSGEEE